jgi:CAAX prenyl protease-like protein
LESLPQGWAITWLIFKVLGSVIMVPLAEELAFRGYLTRRLISSDFQSVPPGRLTWISFVVSSLVFGVLHGRWFAGTLAGMAFALAYRRRGELCDAVLAHGVTNALIAVTVLAARDWSLWA